ncbi:D-alanyl-D-alanine carboxypeptidase family protein [Streptomyces sp. H27-D2]|uniref:D-alanyl-D-alanine carboxypeptidase family protein n=1 Tax=Streptomyces sp. H27-D2 TaxID=3046304 RepID=UPI002DBD1EA6|nr:serine hydrolase [Streptomyces sp. H27-D2]MEC4018663.1 serine hydrolase [Streptomyces sp. H27-D2]
MSAAVVMAGLAVSCPTAVAQAQDAQHNQPQPRAGGHSLDRSGVQVQATRGVPALPRALSGQAWAVTDARTGQVLAAKNAHRRLAPASTLKILFALTVLPKFPQNLVHEVTSEELTGIKPGSSLVGVQKYKRYQVADLWRGVFLSSGNDAVRTLAVMNGGWRATSIEMQATARRLGAHDTRVKSPDGYDTPGQVSSAHDLSVFARAGLADADFARYASTVSARFPAAGGRNSFGIRNTNRLLSGADGVARYRGLTGVKNGYTSRAGNTLVVTANRGGQKVLVAVMDPRSGRPQAVYEEARSLLDWGFAAVGKATPVGTLPTGSTTAVSDSRAGDHPPSSASPRAAAKPESASVSVSHTSTGHSRWPLAAAALALVGGAAVLWRGRVRVPARARRPLRRRRG